jgi:ATP-dependent helicase/nuclease subunit B
VRQTAEDGLTYVMIDYKTERLDKTKARVTDPTEDTQLAFYIALNEPQRVTDNASLDAFYLNLNSRNDSGGPLAQAVRAKDPDTASDRLITGLQLDWDRLKDNHPVRAIGEGDICTHCAARGLCRKAFWDL